MLPALLAAFTVLPLAQHPGSEALPDEERQPAAGEALISAHFGIDPRPTTSFGAVVIDGWLYKLGGYFGKAHVYERERQSGDFYRISMADPSRVEILTSPGRMQSVALVEHEGDPIRIGGMTILNGTGEQHDLASLEAVERFDASSNRWEPLPPLPEPRSSHDATVLEGVLYVFGGWRLGGHESDSSTWFDHGLALDLNALEPEWRAVAQPFQRRALVAWAHGDRVFVAGGIDSEGEISSAVHAFDPATSEWTALPDFPESGFGIGLTSLGEELVACGMDGGVFRMQPDEDAWRPAGELLFTRFFHRLLPDPDGGVIALGGTSREGRPAEIERLVPEGDAQLAVRHWTLPRPGRAHNRQGLSLRGDELLLFGGNGAVDQHAFGPDDFLDEVFSLNLVSMRWTREQPLPARRQSIQTASVGDGELALAVGGFGHDGEVARTIGAAHAFDYTTRTWGTAGILDVPARSQSLLFEHDGASWMFGGQETLPDGEGDVETIYTDVVWRTERAADGQRRFVDSGVRLPVGRCAMAGALFEGQVVLVGGMRAGFEPIETVDVFDLESGEWSEWPAPAVHRLGGRLVVQDGRLVLVGGAARQADGSFGGERSIEVFETGADGWRTLDARLPVEPRRIQALAWRDRVLVHMADDPDGAGRVHLFAIDVEAPGAGL